jgi:hypothetical protein
MERLVRRSFLRDRLGRALTIWRALLTAFLVIVGTIGMACSAAAYLTVFGGPTYDGSLESGYVYPDLPLAPGSTAGNGMAIASIQTWTGGVSIDERPFRWDATHVPAELGNLGTDEYGDTHTVAYAINSLGTTVGYSKKPTTGAYQAVRWDALGVAATELGKFDTRDLGDNNSAAFAINDSGVAVGYATKYDGDLSEGNAVRWDASGNITDLGWGGEAVAINAAGSAVGFGATSSGNRAYRWNATDSVGTQLGNIGTDSHGTTQTYATAISATGTAVGESFKYTSGSPAGYRAVRWDASGTSATELGNLGVYSYPYYHTLTQVNAINAAGTAVGYAQKMRVTDDYRGNRAVRWDASGAAATELGNLGTDKGGTTNTQARAINNGGLIVGYADKYDAAGQSLGARAVLWNTDGVAIDLNSLIDPNSGWTLNQAYAISDANSVTGFGTFDPGGSIEPYIRAFLIDVSGAVTAPSVGGDYNGNGIVDAADYTVWRDHVGQNYTLANRDPGAIGPIGASDYAYWVAHFGQSGSGSGSTVRSPSRVPEPETLLLAIMAVIACGGFRAHSRHFAH